MNNSQLFRPKVTKALKILGIQNFLLGIHDGAFPSHPEEDTGRGSPYTDGAAEFLKFAEKLGFNGIQLGPQGITTPENPSPYDGTLFSKNPLSLSPMRLTREPWQFFTPENVSDIIKKGSLAEDRVQFHLARKNLRKLTSEIYKKFQQDRGSRLNHLFECFCKENSTWLERDAIYEILRRKYGGRNWRQWKGSHQARLDRNLFAQPSGSRRAEKRIKELYHFYGRAIEEYKLIQFLLAKQHKELRKECKHLGLKIFGDFQIGLSGRDTWYAQPFLLRNYVMGAPPSRTNPEGQPWNYPIYDPRKYYHEVEGEKQSGPALDFLQARINKLFAEFDGLRIDHPHGLVCPWVYRSDMGAPIKSVQKGARLFSSPFLKDHPELAEFAIPRPDQIDRRKERYDDHWVSDLDYDQVLRYAVLFDKIMEFTRSNGRTSKDIACEILSTQPYPIKRVMDLYGLGRFRVTQKIDLTDNLDVYRSENAEPEDWVMAGNHDTPSLWQIADKWIKNGKSHQQAAYLAERLDIAEDERAEWIEQTAGDTGKLVQAKFADLFVGPARNIQIFFTDLLGIKETYNVPGTVNQDNWSLRVTPDFQKKYLADVSQRRALNIPKALAMALRADKKSVGEHPDLIKILENQPHYA